MALTINHDRLKEIVIELLGEVKGICCTAGVAIGEVDGKEIYLSVTSEDDEKSGLNEKYKCVGKGA